MATNKNINECGWFYHAPAKPKVPSEPVPLPATSQIPGLNAEIEGQYQDDPIKPLFRETDSKYIRLAKQGGRQNLLQFKENPNMRERAPKGYPRPEWFYLEDNALEDAELKRTEQINHDIEYQYMVPEYMVHEEWKPETDCYERPRRQPFSFDRLSAFERDGDRVTDKTVKLPEVKKPGFGVRSAKPLKTKPRPQERTKPSTIAKQSQLELERPHLKYLPLPEGDTNGNGKPSMSKILGYEYEKKWHDDINKWQFKQDKLRAQHKAMLNEQEKEQGASEYRSTFGKPARPQYVQEKGRKVYDTRSYKSPTTDKAVNQEKELFKLTRFKNVGSKIDSHNPLVTSNSNRPAVASH
ncbi:Hypothetical predicted protein [Mytilus galloprovincialis]|uniref:Uncharacterized protein n=1 Tax=Mytilus galloprovincialis TaxID=29158 RepID=A0A8B6EX58_MYTGA|nr:Hypothetical predicted protein [Mytilus galloprovincialis]